MARAAPGDRAGQGGRVRARLELGLGQGRCLCSARPRGGARGWKQGEAWGGGSQSSLGTVVQVFDMSPWPVEEGLPLGRALGAWGMCPAS